MEENLKKLKLTSEISDFQETLKELESATEIRILKDDEAICNILLNPKDEWAYIRHFLFEVKTELQRKRDNKLKELEKS